MPSRASTRLAVVAAPADERRETEESACIGPGMAMEDSAASADEEGVGLELDAGTDAQVLQQPLQKDESSSQSAADASQIYRVTSLRAQRYAQVRPDGALVAPISARPGGALQVIARTWGRDAHRLFDFEMEHLPTQSFTVAGSTKFLRSGEQVQMLSLREAKSTPLPPDDTEPLLSIVQDLDGGFWVKNMNLSTSSHRPWWVVPSVPEAGFPVCQGDVLRLGRCKLRVRQLVHKASGSSTSGEARVLPDLRLSHSDAVHPISDVGQDAVCRICLLEGPGEEGDPLLAPCGCKGSIEHVHLGCLRHWIADRMHFGHSSNRGEAFTYRSLNCELCKEAYPTYIRGGPSGMAQEPLASLPEVEPPFAVLEDTTHRSPGLYVLPLGDKALKIGRSSDCDVVVEDVTISRNHAEIRYKDGVFLLEDCHSKFGTSLAMREPRRVVPGAGAMTLQNGRTVFTLTQELK